MPPEPNDPNPYSFDDNARQQPNRYPGTPEEQRKWNQRKRKPTEEDESLTEDVLDEIDEGLGCSQRLLGCGWSLITLPFRLVWKVISEIFD